MIPPRTTHARASREARGFTLVELVLASAIMSILLLGLASAAGLAMRAAEMGAKGDEARTPEAGRIIEQLTSDLRLALQFTTPLTAHEAEFTVPDLDGDGQPERITWTWSGDPDYTLWRQETLSNAVAPAAPIVVAEDVREFDLTFVTKTWGPPPPPPALWTDELLLIAHDDGPAGDGTRALLVTAAAAPSAHELTREGLLGSWGFAVSRIAASASPAVFDAAMANADVVYLPHSVDGAILDDKLSLASVGVVSENPDLVDELGFAAAPGTAPAVAGLSVLSPAHYVTSTLGGGPLSLFTGAQPALALPNDAADRAPGAFDLGAWASAPALTAVERDARLYGAGAAGTFGYDAVFTKPTAPSAFQQVHVATRVTLTEGANVHALSAYLYMRRSKDIRFGLYADDGGEPGALIVETDAMEFTEGTTGWCSIALQRNTDLQPGDYWLTIGMQKDVSYHFESDGGVTRYGDSDSDPKNGLMRNWFGTYGPDPNERRISIRAEYTPASFASGRRVCLPWGEDGFNVNALTDMGKDVMRRSVEWAADPTPGDTSVDAQVGTNLWLAQYARPLLPVNTLSWSVDRILVAIRANPDDLDGEVTFELRHATPSLVPGDEIIQTTGKIPTTNWDPYAFTWYEIPLTPVADLNPDYGICLVLQGRRDTDAFVKLDSGPAGTAGTHFVTSSSDGASWSIPGATDDMRFYMFGRYATQGEPVW